MKTVSATILALLLCSRLFAQSDVQPIFDVEKAFEQAVSNDGIRSAYLEFLADDSVVFRPEPINGKQFWEARQDGAGAILIRSPLYADIAANGMMGFVTGSWGLYPKGKAGPRSEFGQYVTIWEKKPDGKFRASLDMGVTREDNAAAEKKKREPPLVIRDPNRSGWSVTDSAMDFLRMSMSESTLGGAYKKFAADDVRLLQERDAPLEGKKHVVSEMKRYKSVEFPKKVNLYESADMAYIWNPCEYANNDEGAIKGNCLHIWKLRDKKWWIVLGVFAPFPNDTPPILKSRGTSKKR